MWETSARDAFGSTRPPRRSVRAYHRRPHIVRDHDGIYDLDVPEGPDSPDGQVACGLAVSVDRRSGAEAGDGSGCPAHATVAGLRGAVKELDGLELAALGDRALIEHTVELDRQVARLEALRARALREIDQRAAFTQDACVSVKGLLVHRTRRDPARASAVANAALRTSQLTALRYAWEAGEVSSDHVMVITRAASGHRSGAIADNEGTLVELARAATPREVAAACRRIADAVDRDANDRQLDEFGDRTCAAN